MRPDTLCGCAEHHGHAAWESGGTYRKHTVSILLLLLLLPPVLTGTPVLGQEDNKAPRYTASPL